MVQGCDECVAYALGRLVVIDDGDPSLAAVFGVELSESVEGVERACGVWIKYDKRDVMVAKASGFGGGVSAEGVVVDLHAGQADIFVARPEDEAGQVGFLEPALHLGRGAVEDPPCGAGFGGHLAEPLRWVAAPQGRALEKFEAAAVGLERVADFVENDAHAQGQVDFGKLAEALDASRYGWLLWDGCHAGDDAVAIAASTGGEPTLGDELCEGLAESDAAYAQLRPQCVFAGQGF